MQNQEAEISFFQKIRRKLRKARPIKKDDLGVHHYVWLCDTFNEDSNGLKYDVYVKLKAIEVYDDLVEVDVINIKVNNSASQDVINLITNSFPKYVKPNRVQWQVASNDTPLVKN